MSIYAITATDDHRRNQRTRLAVVHCTQDAANYIVTDLAEDEDLAHNSGLCSGCHNYKAEAITDDDISARDMVVDAQEMTPNKLRELARGIGQCLW